MKTIIHRSLSKINILVEFERFVDGQPAPIHVALAESYNVLKESDDGWRWRGYNCTSKNVLTKHYYLIWGENDDFANAGFTHLLTPTGRAVTLKSALKQFNNLVKATEFVTFKKI